MYELLIIGYLVVAIAIVVLVLIQRGKGSDMGSSFGAGASATLFGSSGSGNFLTRTTTILGMLFFVISILLSNLGNRTHSSNSGEFSNIGDETPAVTQQSNEQPVTKSPTSDIPE